MAKLKPNWETIPMPQDDLDKRMFKHDFKLLTQFCREELTARRRGGDEHRNEERSVEFLAEDPESEKARMRRNRNIIKFWKENPLTIADLIVIAEDMQERKDYARQDLKKRHKESPAEYENRLERWHQANDAALRAVQNCIAWHKAAGKLH